MAAIRSGPLRRAELAPRLRSEPFEEGEKRSSERSVGVGVVRDGLDFTLPHLEGDSRCRNLLTRRVIAVIDQYIPVGSVFPVRAAREHLRPASDHLSKVVGGS